MGGSGLYAPTFRYDRNPQCVVCGEGVVLQAAGSASLTQLLDMMGEDARLRLKSPSVTVENGKKGDTLFMRGILEKHYQANLDVPLIDLFDSGATLHVTDPGVPSAIKIIVEFSD